MNDMIRYLCPKCVECGKQATLMISKAQLVKWLEGDYIQVAMPQLSADDRELIISGTHPKCFEELFGDGYD